MSRWVYARADVETAKVDKIHAWLISQSHDLGPAAQGRKRVLMQLRNPSIVNNHTSIRVVHDAAHDIDDLGIVQSQVRRRLAHPRLEREFRQSTPIQTPVTEALHLTHSSSRVLSTERQVCRVASVFSLSVLQNANLPLRTLPSQFEISVRALRFASKRGSQHQRRSSVES